MQTAKDAAQTAYDTLSGKPGFSQTDVKDLHGKTALVTGGVMGIGFEVAKALALSRARVLLLSRKEEHGEEAIAKIKEVNPSADLKFISIDLGNLADVKRTADEIRESEERLDLLIADAGVGVNAWALSSDGIDRHMAVNHFGHFLLINRLLPLVRKTAAIPNNTAPRIVSLSSELHRTCPSNVDFTSTSEVYENKDELGPNQLYARTKLAVLLFIKYGLVERVLVPNGDRIWAAATHPGAVHTAQQDQFKEAYGDVFGTVMKYVTIPFMRTPEQGSLSTLYAATSDDVEKNNWQGKYYTDPGKVGGESNQACDEKLGANLWALSHTVIREKLGPDGLLSWDTGAGSK